MRELLIIITISILTTSCAGTRSYKYSASTVSVGSNVYIEGGFGRSKITEDAEESTLDLEYEEHSTSKFKTSADLGIKLWDIIFAVEAGRVLDDFERTIKDVTVEGDRRVVETFKANTNYQRVSLTRRSTPESANIEGAYPSFVSFQLYYDYLVDSSFYDLPTSDEKNIKGTGYGASLGVHIASLYYNIGYNWREYESELKMEEMYLSIGLAFLVF